MKALQLIALLALLTLPASHFAAVPDGESDSPEAGRSHPSDALNGDSVLVPFVSTAVTGPFKSMAAVHPVLDTITGIQNSQSVPGELEFSRDAGFYNHEFYLDITHPDPDVVILYTLDGSEPADGSRVWDGPKLISDRSEEANTISMIRTTNIVENSSGSWVEPSQKIRKGTVIRAAAKKPGYLPGKVVSRSFFVFPEGSSAHQLPVFSLVTNPDNLFDHETGIYVPGADGASGNLGDGNFNNRGEEWERPGSLEFFESGGSPVLRTDMGYRIHGGWSRRYAQKTLRLYARSQYGDNRFYYRFFPNEPYHSYNRLLLRSSGNDTGQTLFRDALAQSLVSHFNMDTQAYRPSVLYINGEYWGIHNIRERYDKHYLARVYGVDPENVDLLTGNNNPKEGDNLHYRNMIQYAAENDLSQTEHYETMQTLMDIDNYLDYYTAHVYFANDDWPHNNIDFWRERVPFDSTAPAGRDGRWRWLLYDIDRSFNLVTRSHTNMIEWITAPVNERLGAEWPNLLFRNLLENEEFRHDFINRIAGYLNSAFLPEHVKSRIDRFREPLETEIRNHIIRWQNPQSYDGWLNNPAGVNEMYDFADERPEYLRTHVRDHFGIGEDVMLTVDVSDDAAGYITVNSLEITGATPGISGSPYPWSGSFFRDIPVTMKAKAWPGYRFSYWVKNGQIYQDRQLVLNMNEDIAVEAVFEETGVADLFPVPYRTDSGKYQLTGWPAGALAGSFPENMAFVYMDEEDPSPTALIEGFTDGAYNLDSRTRINGLGTDGFAFINTGNLEGNPGYPGRRLGGALLALDTRGSEEVYLGWTAGTVRPNSRVYHLRLQYRVGSDGEFRDFPDRSGNAIEYERNDLPGHHQFMGPLALPKDALNKPYVQIFWRYYYTGRRLDEESGQRSKLRVADIRVTDASGLPVPAPLEPSGNDHVSSENLVIRWSGIEEADHYHLQLSDNPDFDSPLIDLENIQGTITPVLNLGPGFYYWRVRAGNPYWVSAWSAGESFRVFSWDPDVIPGEITLLPNYPNPFNPATTIVFGLPEPSHVKLHIYTITGQQVKTLVDGMRGEGYHQVNFDGTELASGVYIYRLQTSGYTESRKMLYLK